MTGYGQSLGQALGQFAFGGNTQDATMKGMLAGAQANQFDASAKKSLAEALKAEAEVRGLQKQEEARSPQNILRNAAQAFGIPSDDMPAVEQFIKTGKLGGGYAPSIDGMGPAMPQPDYARNLPSLLRQIGTTNQALTVGDKSVKNIAEASAISRISSLKDDVLAGKQDPTRFAQAEYAGDGKAPFSFNEYGVGNMLTGTLDDKTGPAIRFGDKRIAETKAQQANARQSDASAASSYASANNSNASAAKTKEETKLVGNGKWQYDSARGGLVNLATGEFKAATQDGKPIGSKVDEKPLNDTQAKANLFGTRMQEANRILERLEKAGVTDSGVIKGAIEGAVGLTPFIGDKLSDAAGSVMNAVPGVLGGPSGAQQQVGQAKRDFINAVLRRESGAAIAPSEFANADRQYFPQPGDDKNVLAQKRRNRELAVQGLEVEVPGGFRGTPAGNAPKVRGAEGKVIDFGDLK